MSYSENRRPLYFNPAAKAWRQTESVEHADLIDEFHKSLPGAEPTPLCGLPNAAREIGVGKVYMKDESQRFGLSSFKVLGASWGAYRAVVKAFGLPLDAGLEAVRKTAAAENVTFFTTTAGNHGLALARVGVYFSAAVEIHVPSYMAKETIARMESEKASVVVSTGSYDDAAAEAWDASQKVPNGLMVQDYAFEGYEELPRWIQDGYSTMMREIDEQLEKQPDLVVTPVGVGSLAYSVLSHCKSKENGPMVMAVEPDTAACLWKSLSTGTRSSIATTTTIMAGLRCETVSSHGWPSFRQGMDASITVSDYEAHQSCEYLHQECNGGVNGGPCGSGTLAALRRLAPEDKKRLGLGPDSVVVLLCTERSRPYETPRDVSVEDPIKLTQTMVQINSANPALGSSPGPGEAEIANYITAWLEHRNIEAHWVEPTAGRPSVVGIVRGTGGGKSLMLNGHSDTVTLSGFDGDALGGELVEGRIRGRGACDMKCGLAAAMCALLRARDLQLRGDVLLAAVADEEATSIGTEAVLDAGWRADAAIVSEPTNLDVVHAHGGFTWAEVDVHGVAAHGSLPGVGVDAICLAGHVLVALEAYTRRLLSGPAHKHLGPGSAHASIIRGGEEESSYPAKCTIVLERRLMPGETADGVKAEIQDLFENVLLPSGEKLKYDVRFTLQRPPLAIPEDHPLVQLVKKHAGGVMGREPALAGVRFWTDCALLAAQNIPSVLWGPHGEGLHGKDEWVDARSIEEVADGLTAIAADFCQ